MARPLDPCPGGPDGRQRDGGASEGRESWPPTPPAWLS